MRYAMLLKPHPNVRYRQSLQKLALRELVCVLDAWAIEHEEPQLQSIAGETFLCFEAGQLTQEAWRAVAGHSAICLAAELLEGDALRPLARPMPGALPDELPHVLKYKGKTNADFTYMMLHCAKAASAFAQAQHPLCVLDPMCGKGTTLLCALCEGNDALGVECDAKALRELEGYLERALKLHRIKHKRTGGAMTLPKGESSKWTEYAIAPDAQHMKTDARTLRLTYGDAGQLEYLTPKASCHLIVSDLPYGVQHAPKEGHGMSSLMRLMQRVLPGCVHALKPGGAAAFSFNRNTLRRAELSQAMQAAGLTVLTEPPYDDFSHWVEQAVDRDVVIARKP